MPFFSRLRTSIVVFLIIPAAFAAPVSRAIQQKRQAQSGEQQAAPWHLQRLSSATSVISHYGETPDPNGVYRYPAEAGSGVDIYIMDNPVKVELPEFEGRAKDLFDMASKLSDAMNHGTPVASVAGGKIDGVAKKANLLYVPLTTWSAILANHEKRKKESDWKGSVINVSSGSYSLNQAEDDGIKALVAAGVHVVMAAGNNGREGKNSCEHYPSALDQKYPIISVGAVDAMDTKTAFTNLGSCIDIWAPGSKIQAAGIEGPVDGTSFASPMVAGVLAVELSRDVNAKLREDPAAMKEHIRSIGFPNVVKDDEGKIVPGGILTGFNYLTGAQPTTQDPSTQKTPTQDPSTQQSATQKPSAQQKPTQKPVNPATENVETLFPEQPDNAVAPTKPTADGEAQKLQFAGKPLVYVLNGDKGDGKTIGTLQELVLKYKGQRMRTYEPARSQDVSYVLCGDSMPSQPERLLRALCY
ncbi:Oryzin [Dactylellina cionopaga]|nr:Oryzin [Dactylellina cionopaga]